MLTQDIFIFILDCFEDYEQIRIAKFLYDEYGFEKIIVDFDMFDHNYNDDDLKILSSFKYLTELNIFSCDDISNNGFNYLSNIKNLKTLGIHHCLNFSNFNMTDLISLKNLTSLELPETITDPGFGLLSHFQGLVSLSLFNITDWGCHIISSLTQLKRLEFIGNNRNVANDCVKYPLSKLINLEKFTFINCSTIFKMKWLPQSIKHLNIPHLNIITHKIFNNINHLTKLKSIDLSKNNITDEMFENIKLLTNLTKIDISETNITDNIGIYLRNFKNLTQINISKCARITDKIFLEIQSLNNINWLSINNVNITDQGLFHISKLIDLEWLNISDCKNITDKGLLYLKDLNHLKQLNLITLPLITEIGISYLVNVKFVFVKDCHKINKGKIPINIKFE